MASRLARAAVEGTQKKSSSTRNFYLEVRGGRQGHAHRRTRTCMCACCMHAWTHTLGMRTHARTHACSRRHAHATRACTQTRLHAPPPSPPPQVCRCLPFIQRIHKLDEVLTTAELRAIVKSRFLDYSNVKDPRVRARA